LFFIGNIFSDTCGDEIVALVQGLGGNPPVDVNSRNAYDRTALHWAAGNNNIVAVRLLIQLGSQVDAKVDLFDLRLG
jgi:ankyrin repeat protein